MFYRIAALIFLAVFTSYCRATLDCGEHGVVLACPCARTCDKPEGPDFCTCEEGCSCKGGYLLNENINKCVPADECPIGTKSRSKVVCGENSHLEPCPCKKTCDKPHGPKYCKCQEGCACNFGYLFDELSEKCIPEENCKKIDLKSELSCGENSHIDPCPCKKTCSKPKGNDLCPCITGCSCNGGYLFDEKKKVCVLAEDCPKNKTDGFDSILSIFDKFDPFDPFGFFDSDDKKSKSTTMRPKHSKPDIPIINIFDDGDFDFKFGGSKRTDKSTEKPVTDDFDREFGFDFGHSKHTYKTIEDPDKDNVDGKFRFDFGHPKRIHKTTEPPTKNDFDALLRLFDINETTMKSKVISTTETKTNAPTSVESNPTSTISNAASTIPPVINKTFAKPNNSEGFDVVIILDDPSTSVSQKDCGLHAHMEMCPCDGSCSRPEAPNPCFCIQGCACDKGYVRHDITRKCIRMKECSQSLDDVKKTGIVYKKTTFMTWCCATDEPSHIFFIFLICILIILLICSIISYKKKRDEHAGFVKA